MEMVEFPGKERKYFDNFLDKMVRKCYPFE